MGEQKEQAKRERMPAVARRLFVLSAALLMVGAFLAAGMASAQTPLAGPAVQDLGDVIQSVESHWTTSPDTGRGQGDAGTLNLTWSGASVVTASAAYVDCYATLASNATPQLRYHAVDLSPGQYCIGQAKLSNTGTLPLVIAQTIAPANDPDESCGYLLDSIEAMSPTTIGPALNGQSYTFGIVGEPTIPGGGSITVTFAVGLYADAPQSCAGGGFDYTVSVTGSVPVGNGP